MKCVKCGTCRINPYMTEESADKYYKDIYGPVKRGKIKNENCNILYEKQSVNADSLFT